MAVLIVKVGVVLVGLFAVIIIKHFRDKERM